jgi:hypothetical protein
MTRAIPISLVRRWSWLSFRYSNSWDHERLTCRQRMTDLAVDLKLHFSGEFHGLFHRIVPPLVISRKARDVPFPWIAAYGVMRAFNLFKGVFPSFPNSIWKRRKLWISLLDKHHAIEPSS